VRVPHLCVCVWVASAVVLSAARAVRQTCRSEQPSRQPTRRDQLSRFALCRSLSCNDAFVLLTDLPCARVRHVTRRMQARRLADRVICASLLARLGSRMASSTNRLAILRAYAFDMSICCACASAHRILLTPLATCDIVQITEYQESASSSMAWFVWLVRSLPSHTYHQYAHPVSPPLSSSWRCVRSRTCVADLAQSSNVARLR
jgi:hypothetical protein